MKFFTEPKVYLIAKPQLHVSSNLSATLDNWNSELAEVPGILDFFEDMDNYGGNFPEEAWVNKKEWAISSTDSDADLLPEFCGRMCYCAFGTKQGRKSNVDYLQNIIESGHGSVLEHANFTFLVAQCSRGFTHEMVRHRAGFAYSQESTHYINYNIQNGRICLDPRICEIENLYSEMQQITTQALKAYAEYYKKLKLKYPKKEACSMARQILPIGIEAKLAFTANVRALRHFMVMRGNMHNVAEIRKVACQVFKILKVCCPNSLHGLSLISADQEWIKADTDKMGKI